MSDHYILEGREVIPVDLMTWAAWFENFENRRVALTKIDDEVSVSTVFLGLDHSFGDGPPLLFESLVLGGDDDEDMDRYSTYDEAEAGHAAMVKRVQGEL